MADRDVFFRGKFESSTRKSKTDDIDEKSFWCVWKNEKNESFLVGKTQNCEKVHFRIIDLTTLNFKVTRLPIDRKLKYENGRYMQLFHLYRNSILNLANLDFGESLVFLQFDLNTYQTEFHRPIPMQRRDLAQEMSYRNTVIWGNYFFFVRKVALDSGKRQIHAEVYRYNVAKKGRFRCISNLPQAATRGGYPPVRLSDLTFDAIASNQTGIVLFGIKPPQALSYSQKVALLDVRRNRWTLFPQCKKTRKATQFATMERMFVADSGGDILFVKRISNEVELWSHNIYSRETVHICKITAIYVELVYRISANNILIVTRENDHFYLIRKGQQAPLSLRQLCADALKRHNMHKPPNAQLKELGLNRKFFNMLIRD